MVILTAQSILFTAFSNIFFENRSIFDTILFSISDKKHQIDEFFEPVSQDHDSTYLYMVFDLTGSWENNGALITPEWYSKKSINGLNTDLNLTGKVEKLEFMENVSLLELAKVRTLLLLSEIKNNQLNVQIKVFGFKDDEVTLIEIDADNPSSFFNSKKGDFTILAKKIVSLKSNTDSKYSDFRSVLAKMKQEFSLVGDKKLKTLIVFSDFEHRLKDVNNDEGRDLAKSQSELFDNLTELCHKNVYSNFVKPQVINSKSTTVLLFDEMVKQTPYVEFTRLIDLTNNEYPHDISSIIRKSDSEIVFYYSKDEKIASTEILPTKKNQSFTMTLVSDFVNQNKVHLNENLSYKITREGDETKVKEGDFISFIPMNVVPITHFNGSDNIKIQYNETHTQNPKRNYVLEFGLEAGSESKRIKVNTHFESKIPRWVAMTFLMSFPFLFAGVISLLYFIYHKIKTLP